MRTAETRQDRAYDGRMEDVRCWWCGVKPIVVFEEQRLCQAEPSYRYNWPNSDHDHAVKPPTPGQLLAEGGRAYDRLIAVW
jgi:hypothetical protein